MTKTELKKNITKITQILQSENCEAGFELLRTKNDPALNEALSDLIQSRVRSKYFEEVSDQKEVDKGLEILTDLLPNLTSLDLSDCSMKNLDVSKFKNIITLNLSNCDSLENIDGLYGLKSLSSPTLTSPPALDLKNSPLLTNLDVEKIKSLPNLDFEMDVVGLRDNNGLLLNHFGDSDWEYWHEAFEEFLKQEFERALSPTDEFFGNVLILWLHEDEFWDYNFGRAQKPAAGHKASDVDSLELLIGEEEKNKLGLFFDPPKTFPAKDEVLLLLYTYGVQTFLYWWISNSSEYSIDCDECGDTFTFAETIQVDPEVEKIRCCPDCAKERNKKKSMK